MAGCWPAGAIGWALAAGIRQRFKFKCKSKFKYTLARGWGSRCGRRWNGLLDRAVAVLFGPDADRFLNRQDEDLAVADLSRLGGCDDGIHGALHAVVR